MTKKEIMEYIDTIPEDDPEKLFQLPREYLVDKIIKQNEMITKVYEMLDDLWEP